jgi:hypothetical protein
VEHAETWGDEVWQAVARRLLWVAFDRARGAMPSYQEHARWRLPAPVVQLVAPGAILAERKMNDATEPRARDDLRARCRATSTGSTRGWPVGCSAARRRTPPTCRSPLRRGCC